LLLCRRESWENLEAKGKTKTDFLHKGSALIQSIARVGPSNEDFVEPTWRVSHALTNTIILPN
jgi:hypothetical protein